MRKNGYSRDCPLEIPRFKFMRIVNFAWFKRKFPAEEKLQLFTSPARTLFPRLLNFLSPPHTSIRRQVSHAFIQAGKRLPVFLILKSSSYNPLSLISNHYPILIEEVQISDHVLILSGHVLILSFHSQVVKWSFFLVTC